MVGYRECFSSIRAHTRRRAVSMSRRFNPPPPPPDMPRHPDNFFLVQNPTPVSSGRIVKRVTLAGGKLRGK